MIIPATRYRDCEEALDFLTEVLGLHPHAVFRDDDGKIVHVQMSLGAGMMMFGPDPDPDQAEGDAFGKLLVHPADIDGRETTTIYVVVDDVEARHERVAGKADVIMPLAEQDYGGKSFSVADPEGHIWTFGDYDPTKSGG